MKALLLVVAFGVAAQPGIAAERANSPSDATVFVRLVGSVHAEIDELGIRRTADRDRVEVGTGSGFVISPYGYILTNEHVVSSGEILLTEGLAKARITMKVSRIDVCFSTETARDVGAACVEASVYAADPNVDLAVLFIGASNVPYIGLGDSDAVAPGQPVRALGYPFGRRVEVGRVAVARDVVPEVSTTAGTISALRSDESGGRRYLQISSPVNPGNSGGPVIDQDGFAVGVVRMGLKAAAGIAFAIPSNQVKDFLDSHGLDRLMPVHRLRLGPRQSHDAKAIALRVPENAAADTSPFRARVEADVTSTEMALRIDRVLSPWTLKQIEESLVKAQAFERIVTSASNSLISAGTGGRRLLLGRASGSSADGAKELGMAYAVLDLGDEKLVARYIGPSAQLVFNESILRESLASLDGQPLVAPPLDPVATMEWSTPRGTDGQQRLPVPRGWIVEPSAPMSCPGLPQTSGAAAALAPRDFTVALRAAVWSSSEIVPDDAAVACSARRGILGRSSYVSRVDWLGTSFSIEGVFVTIGPRQIAQLEVVMPDSKSAYARALLAAWVQKATER